MILNEEKFKEINYKFCKDIQERFVKFMEELEESKCIKEIEIANEAIYSLGSNVASCIYDICPNIELAKHISGEVSECTNETLEILYKPQLKEKSVANLGEGVKCND